MSIFLSIHKNAKIFLENVPFKKFFSPTFRRHWRFLIFLEIRFTIVT